MKSLILKPGVGQFITPGTKLDGFDITRHVNDVLTSHGLVLKSNVNGVCCFELAGGSGGPTTNTLTFNSTTGELISTVNGVASTVTLSIGTTTNDIVTSASFTIYNPTSNADIAYPVGTTLTAVLNAIVNSTQPAIQFKEDNTDVGARGAFSNINFVGAGVTASISGTDPTELVVTIPGGGSGLTLENESVAVSGTFSTLDFVGTGVNVTGTAPNGTVEIPGFVSGNGVPSGTQLAGSKYIDTATGIMYESNGSGIWTPFVAPNAGTVKVSATDTTAGYLGTEITAANFTSTIASTTGAAGSRNTGLKTTIVNAGAAEVLNISMNTGGLDAATVNTVAGTDLTNADLFTILDVDRVNTGTTVPEYRKLTAGNLKAFVADGFSYGTGTPAGAAATYIGQEYLNTTTGQVYAATAVGTWSLIYTPPVGISRITVTPTAGAGDPVDPLTKSIITYSGATPPTVTTEPLKTLRVNSNGSEILSIQNTLAGVQKANVVRLQLVNSSTVYNQNLTNFLMPDIRAVGAVTANSSYDDTSGQTLSHVVISSGGGSGTIETTGITATSSDAIVLVSYKF